MRLGVDLPLPCLARRRLVVEDPLHGVWGLNSIAGFRGGVNLMVSGVCV